jgi:hypothetical protein
MSSVIKAQPRHTGDFAVVKLSMIWGSVSTEYTGHL